MRNNGPNQTCPNLAIISPPKRVLKQIESLFANFFWGEPEWGQNRHWLPGKAFVSLLEKMVSGFGVWKV